MVAGMSIGTPASTGPDDGGAHGPSKNRGTRWGGAGALRAPSQRAGPGAAAGKVGKMKVFGKPQGGARHVPARPWEGVGGRRALAAG